MKNIISIKNMNFKYNNKQVFKDFSLDLEEGSYTTIIGPNGSGKTTLVRIILGLIKSSGDITIDDKKLDKDNIKDIIKQIGVVFENPDDQFVAETVMDDIAFSLENLQIKPREIKRKVKEISDYIGITDILEREPHTLSGGEKQLVSLASALIIEPKILILDEALTMIDLDIREKIYKILAKINKDKKITIINVTHEMDETLYGDDIVLLDKGQIILQGTKEDVLSQEKIFNNLGLSLPFMVELSIKLRYYNLLDRIIFDMDEMVEQLWK